MHPEANFHLVFSDDMPECPAVTTAAFDSIINIRDLPIDNLRSWIFRHRLVELCTAVKGTAFQYIAETFGAERIYYFDPDILEFNGRAHHEEEIHRAWGWARGLGARARQARCSG